MISSVMTSDGQVTWNVYSVTHLFNTNYSIWWHTTAALYKTRWISNVGLPEARFEIHRALKYPIVLPLYKFIFSCMSKFLDNMDNIIIFEKLCRKNTVYSCLAIPAWGCTSVCYVLHTTCRTLRAVRCLSSEHLLANKWMLRWVPHATLSAQRSNWLYPSVQLLRQRTRWPSWGRGAGISN